MSSSSETYQNLMEVLDKEAAEATQKAVAATETIKAAEAAYENMLNLMRSPIIFIGGGSALDIEDNRNRNACVAYKYILQQQKLATELTEMAEKKTEKKTDVYTSLQILANTDADPKRKALAEAYLETEAAFLQKTAVVAMAAETEKVAKAAYDLIDKPGVYADVLFPVRDVYFNALRAAEAARVAVWEAQEVAIKASCLQVLGTPDADPKRKALARTYLEDKVEAIKRNIQSCQQSAKDIAEDIEGQPDPGDVNWRDGWLKMTEGWKNHLDKLETDVKVLTEKAAALEVEIENTLSLT